MRDMAFTGRLLAFAASAALLAPGLVSCGSGSHGAAPAVIPNTIHQTSASAPQAAVWNGAMQSGAVQARFEIDGASPDTCNVFPLVCVDQGSSASVGIKVTCTRNGHPINCGSVHWTTKTSHAGLTASFKPNPGNPTKETVKAASSVPAGTKYTQTIHTTCSMVPNCPTGTFPIHVTP